MRITFSQELKEYMVKKKKEAVIIEVASSDGDFEVVELHPHFVSKKQAELFVTRKGFHRLETDHCPVLLPNYRLDYAEELHFWLKKAGPFHLLKADGVAL